MTELLEKQPILQPDDSIYPATEDWESDIYLLERRRLCSCVMEEISALIVASPPRPRSLLDRRCRKLPPLPLDNSKTLRCSYHGCACTDPSCPLRNCYNASSGAQKLPPLPLDNSKALRCSYHECSCVDSSCPARKCDTASRGFQTDDPIHICTCDCDIAPCCVMLRDIHRQPLHTCSCGDRDIHHQPLHTCSCGDRDIHHQPLHTCSCGDRDIHHQPLHTCSCGDRDIHHQPLHTCSCGDRDIHHQPLHAVAVIAIFTINRYMRLR